MVTGLKINQNISITETWLSDNIFDEHLENTIVKAQKMAWWILRTFKTRERLPLMTQFKQMVLEILEYCYPLWSPTDKGTIEENEKVQ